MKLKKWGALLLALCMIVMVFPTTAMADENTLSGPDAEKKVIENDLIVQLPSSLDDMIGTSAGNGDWLAVTSEPEWENDTILSYVRATQEFYDSTGKKLADADTFQNNSRYTMKMTFQSFESYHGDYYYVLSGDNNVYVEYMNGTGEREPMKVTVNKDENGNPVITATYSFSIGTPPEEPAVPGDATSDWAFSCEDHAEGIIRGKGSFYMTITNTSDSVMELGNELKVHVLDCNDNDRELTYNGIPVKNIINVDVVDVVPDFSFEPGESREFRVTFNDNNQLEESGTEIPYLAQIRDADGNIVFEQKVTMTYSNPDATYELVFSSMNDPESTPLNKVTAVIGRSMEYRVVVVRISPDGTKEPMRSEDMFFEYGFIYADTNTKMDVTVEPYYYGYELTVTGKGQPACADGLQLAASINGILLADAYVELETMEPTEIESDTVYNISDKDGQDLYYRYQPTDAPDDGSYRSYTLWTDGGTAEATGNGIFAGEKRYYTFRRQGTDPINFQFSPTTDNARFELVESKRVAKIEFLSVPDSMIQDIRENGSKANLNGFTFKVTYADGSARTYEYSGKKDDNYFVYHMDWTPDGNIYDCSYDSENNAISILGFKEPDAPTIEYYKIPDESKVNIKEGLSEVTGDLGNTEYNTVEKIENKLTETIVSNEGYIADNTALYDIELVTSEDGGQTWVPVTAENFPAEGIVVTLPYPEGTNAADYDFTVVHMFDEDVNGHKAGEVETPEVTEGENGISFRLTGTSPVMVGYKKVAAAHTHSYGKWTDCKDGINHQRSCSCGDVQKETHVWDDGKVTKEATKDAEGIKTYTCKTCGATKTKSIPKLTSDTTPSKPGDSTNPNTDTTSPKTGDSANIALWIVVMLASAAGLSCTYFVKRKKVNN